MTPRILATLLSLVLLFGGATVSTASAAEIGGKPAAKQAGGGKKHGKKGKKKGKKNGKKSAKKSAKKGKKKPA